MSILKPNISKFHGNKGCDDNFCENFPNSGIDPNQAFCGNEKVAMINDLSFLRREIFRTLSDLENKNGYRIALFDMFGDINLRGHFAHELTKSVFETTKDILAFEKDNLDIPFDDELDEREKDYFTIIEHKSKDVKSDFIVVEKL